MIDKFFHYMFPHYHTLDAGDKKKVIRKPLVFVMIALFVLGTFCTNLYKDRDHDEKRWRAHLTPDPKQQQDMIDVSKDAVPVLCGTYVSNVYNITLSKGTYWLTMYTWFRWEGHDDLDLVHRFHIYNCNASFKQVLRNYKEGNTHYQLIRTSGMVAKEFNTRAFPLDSHQFYIYLEPDLSARAVRLIPDKENSSINDRIDIPGFKVTKYDIEAVPYEYKHTRSDIRVERLGKNVSSELLTAFQIDRNGLGLYLKCFIGLFGCTIWVLIVLYLSIYHRVDPLSMVPAALFGCVANMMVGANLLPDALEMGLLEYVNIWGIFIILSVAMVVIDINRIRREEKANGEETYYATVYGRIMFYIVTSFTILGNLALPFVVVATY